ncbi:MAG: BMP family ABC transporter substrate-binding protein [Intestinibacter bartlettii]|uniref:BMP family lipoprotein n=1 Tax=Intestinibacter bartlettii TaxID=261299 RepID=UPI0026ED5665|nr:BMP family ABC transporter substrate-binding protein [Intestinibacter bartlettii]MDO5009548.1 BMP family ABC transporter substrate-binding protein [Intestinibacter bartlettii]
MQLKKLFAIGLAFTMMTTLLVGCSGNKNEANSNSGDKVYTVGMVTDTGGVNDESFNQSTWEGLQKAEEKYGSDKVKVKYLESTQDADYVPNIETFVEEDLDLIIGVGYKTSDAIKEAAENYPEKQFAVVDHSYENQPENVTSLVYEDNTSSYLVGLIAGKMTKTNKVAFIGGMESVVLARFQYGYMAGVKAANPECEVIVRYANSYNDAALGKSIANQMHKDGVDVIFTAAGAVGTGAIEAAKENGKMAIGVDTDQNALAPNNVITSAVKNVDVSVIDLVGQLVDGSYKGGQVIVNTLAGGGVGIAESTSKNVPKDILKYVDEQAELVKSGEITVPENEKEYKEIVGE